MPSLHIPPSAGLTENMVTGDNEKRSKTDAYAVDYMHEQYPHASLLVYFNSNVKDLRMEMTSL